MKKPCVCISKMLKKENTGTAGSIIPINIVTIKRQMNRKGQLVNWMLFFALLFVAGLSSCGKTANVKAEITAQQAKDDQLITTYLKNKGITASVIDSAGVSTGVYYTIDTVGTGNNVYTSSTQVTLGYKAWLLTTGAVLGDQFVTTDKFHPSYTVGAVLRGWQLAFLDITPSIQPGGVITMYVPSHYAYGPYPQPDYGLPANAVLVFQIKVYNITN